METNKVYNADCLPAMSVMADNCVDMLLTDIPYGNVTKNGEKRAKYKGQLREIDKGAADIETFDLKLFLKESARITCGSIYIFCGIEQVSEIYQFFDNHKDFMVRQCGWRKTNPSPANGQHMWLYSIENCIFAKRRKTAFNLSCKSAIWDYPVQQKKIHPTEKPLKLFEYLIAASTQEGDIVFDPCIGSGTTAIAAMKLGRKYIGYELNPEFYTVCTNRISDYMRDGV